MNNKNEEKEWYLFVVHPFGCIKYNITYCFDTIENT